MNVINRFVFSFHHECWHLFVPEGYIIRAWTPHFDLERNYDFMHILCGPNGTCRYSVMSQ